MNRNLVATALLGLALTAPFPATAQQQGGPSALAGLFSLDMQDVQVAFLEQTAGPARRVNRCGTTVEREYTVEGCKVRAQVGRDNSVTAYTLDLSRNCTVDLSDILQRQVPTANALTSGHLTGSGGAVTIPCLTLCGNAADPGGTAAWEGPRSNTMVDVVGRITFADAPTMVAAGKLEDRIQRERGRSYIVEERYNCEPRYRDAAAQALKDLTFTSIAVGRNVVASLQQEAARNCRPARR